MRPIALPADLREFFDRYRAAFDRLDGEAVAHLYAIPSGILSGRTYVHWPDFAAIRENMVALCSEYRNHGYRAASYDCTWVAALGQDAVIVDVLWTIERQDAREPWHFHTTYNLTRFGEGWRILLCTAYEERRFGEAAGGCMAHGS